MFDLLDAERRISPFLLLIAATAVTLLAAAVRLHFLGHDSLWYDEILTRHTAIQGYFDATTMDARDHLPLLYLLVGTALRLLPEQELFLRLPSAVAGILAVPLLVAFGQTARLPRAGLWAALLLALLPFHIRTSQEARHYALLLFFSLLSLYWLYRAMVGNEWRAWLFFGLATALNLLTHYSAWLLLAAEGVLILGWMARSARRHGFGALRPVVPGLLIVGLTLLVLAPRAATALGANAGGAGAEGTTAAASLAIWIKESFLAFGFESALPAGLLVAAALVGLLLLFYERRWLLLAVLLVPSVVPVLLIQLLDVSRWALPKYVIFILPLYLFCIGVTLQVATLGLSRLAPAEGRDRARLLLSGVLALALVFLAWSAVQGEWTRVTRDWRGAVAALNETLGPDDLALALALDTADGYNAGGIAAAYYLDPDLKLLDGNHLDLARVQALAGRKGRVAAVVLDSHRALAAGSGAWQVIPYGQGLFVVRHDGSENELLAELAELYELLALQADAPSPQCSLWGKLALVQMARGTDEAAQAALDAADPDCPLDAAQRRELQSLLDRRRLDTAVAAGNQALVERLAAARLAEDPGDEAALAALTTADLLVLFEEGAAEVEDALAPEPVSRRSFTMPQDGDTGDVLFMHPPATVRFTLDLPAEPLTLVTRIALDPQSWGWGGDGVTFMAAVEGGDGRTDELLRRHVANTDEEQRWHEISLPLAEYANQTVTITLGVDSGPAGDGTGDWAGWERPRLVRLPAT
ncbi:MAG: glycosyltransferase family 39 protein [Candidatus Promineifilaceae bacterium]